MVILCNVDGESRKAMVKAIENELGVKATYLGVPSCAYQIGGFKVGKLGELEFADGEMTEEVSKVIDACILATGVTPEGLPDNESAQEEAENIRQNALEYKNKVEFEVKIKIDQLLKESEVTITDALMLIRSNREELRNAAQKPQNYSDAAPKNN